MCMLSNAKKDSLRLPACRPWQVHAPQHIHTYMYTLEYNIANAEHDMIEHDETNRNSVAHEMVAKIGIWNDDIRAWVSVSLRKERT